MIRADMHVHTYYSDGAQSPADVVAAAKRAGVGLISVTDHDNSNARGEVKKLALASGIISVDGEEISAYDGAVKVHILGYGMDCGGEEYARFHKELYDGAEERALDVLKKLSAVGVRLSYGDVLRERKCKNSPLHGMYIATAGARKGYASSPFDFYARYLGLGKAGFSCVGRPTPEKTAEFVSSLGGVCSLAHPGRITLENGGVEKLVARLIPCGLTGIEAVYSGHTAKETQYYKELAERYNLLVTGGSDTHVSEGNRRVGEPPFYPDERLLSALKIL